jgi:D-threonate/D-erythronate kinase
MFAKSQIIVIADDLSGAAELAGIAFAHGLSAEVQRRFDPNSDAQVIAIDTDSRSLNFADAAQRVRMVADQVAAANPEWIFKKVDSVLRGNLRAEIDAILGATGLARAVLVPANPTRGRTIVGGRYFVNGVPLDQTAFANDPEHPRQSSDVNALLGLKNNSAISVPDTASPADVARHATEVDATALAAGAADFFAALLKEQCGPGVASSAISSPVLDVPALLVCGSQNSWPIRRAECHAAKVPIATMSDAGGQMPFSALLLGIGELKTGIYQPDMLDRLADVANELMQGANVKTVLAEGGATSAAIADRQGWLRLEVAATAPAGVGVLRPLPVGSPLVLIKPGSYSWPREIWESLCRAVGGSPSI